jgi:hypothetical protein
MIFDLDIQFKVTLKFCLQDTGIQNIFQTGSGKLGKIAKCSKFFSRTLSARGDSLR